MKLISYYYVYQYFTTKQNLFSLVFIFCNFIKHKFLRHHPFNLA
jgi:hypothetical protein